jgi:hypothetical protein
MKIIRCGNAFLALSIFCCSGRLFGGDAPAAKVITLNGTFCWNQNNQENDKNPIKIVLTPTATANEYTAVFTFTWEYKAQTIKGTLKRDPKTGVVSGAAETLDKNKKWTFKSATGVMQKVPAWVEADRAAGNIAIQAYANGDENVRPNGFLTFKWAN